MTAPQLQAAAPSTWAGAGEVACLERAVFGARGRAHPLS
jgi:hypothetical protein